MSLLLIVGVGWCTLGVDLLLILCFFLGACVYWLNPQFLDYVLLLVCMDASCYGFESRFLVYVLVDLWTWLGVGVGIVD